MNAKTFRKLALSLPEAHEEPHFDRASFRVGKKIFATMTADGREAMVRVEPMKRLEQLLATQPAVFFSHGAWTTRNGALGVRLGKVNAQLLQDLLLDSWARVAPKRLRAAFDR
jgi:hypothetical protein